MTLDNISDYASLNTLMQINLVYLGSTVNIVLLNIVKGWSVVKI